MATRNRTASARARSRRKPARPNLSDILYWLGEAQSFIAVALQSLDARATPRDSDEERTVLAAGLAALSRVYNDLDRANIALTRAAARHQ